MQTQPNSLSTDGNDDAARFAIRSRVEIGFILRRTMTDGEIVTAQIARSRDTFVTTLLAVDPQNGLCVVDAAKDPAVNRAIASAGSLLFESRHDRIRIRWHVDRCQLADFEGHPSIYIPLPDVLYKYQRREYFRAETPILRSVKCNIPIEGGKPLTVPLFDIGLGGVGLIGFPVEFEVGTGHEFPGCTITLPEMGVLSVTLQVRNIIDSTTPDNRTSRRVGCAFVGLTPAGETMIQRYVTRLERDRRSRLA